MLVRLQSLFNQVNPEWDDFSPGFPENLLLEGMTTLVDLIRGTMEERVRQLSYATVTDRLAAIRLGRLSGFTLPGAMSATVSGRVSLSSGVPHANDITLPANLKVRTNDPTEPKRYRMTTDPAPTITAGLLYVDIDAEQAESQSDTFESNYEPNQELLLDRSPYIDGSASVSAADGSYTAYTTFLGMVATTRGYVVFVDEDGGARIRFGNGINGAIPQGTITVTYKTGGGTAGEVEANALWTIEDVVTDVMGNVVQVKFTNSAASTSGLDAMTVEESRVRGPQSRSVIKRAVVEPDFEYIAVQAGGSARAFLETSDNSSEVAEDYGVLHVVAYGTQTTSGGYKPASPTTAQLNLIAAALTKYGSTPKLMGFSLDITGATFRTVNISMRIYKKSNYAADDVSTNIRTALEDFFAVADANRQQNTLVDFGCRLLGSDGDPDYLIPWAWVLRAILDADGVRYLSTGNDDLLINGSHSSLYLLAHEFPLLGTVTIFDEDQSGVQI